MEALLNKEVVTSFFPSSDFTVEVLSEGDTIVPDFKSDIAEIIYTEARCSSDKIEIQKDRVIFTGTTEFTVLYKPEDEKGAQSLTARFPFNHIEECPGITPSDKTKCSCRVVHSECRFINSRKISLKCVISLSFTAYKDISLELCTDIKYENIQSEKKSVSYSSIDSFAKENFNITETLCLPQMKSPISEILLYRACISDKSIKLVTGKAVIKGTISLFFIYTSTEGTTEYMEEDILFTEIADIKSLSDDKDCVLSLTLENYSVSPKTNADNEMKDLSFSAELKLSLLGFQNHTINIVSDAYVPGNESTLSYIPFNKAEIIERKNDSLTIKDSAELPMENLPIEQLCPVYSYISSEEVTCSDGKITVSGTICSVIIYTSGNEIATFNKEMSFSSAYDCPSNNICAFADICVSHTDYNFINSSKIDLRCIVDISLTVRQDSSEEKSIDNFEVGPAREEKRPSLTIYFVKSKDTLWDIAKNYGTTVDKIIFANNMSRDDVLNSGMRLLIPA